MTIHRVFLPILITLLSLTLHGCDLTGGDDSDETSVATTGAYVANQGNFADGNGSITLYDPETQDVESDAITGLSSIVQGIAVRDTSLYVLANSAARLDVFSTNSLAQTGQLQSDLSGPRYIAFINNATAYVTDQSFGGSSSVHALDLSGDQPEITSTISVPGTPEGIASVSGKVYAALGAFGDTSLVASIDPANNTLTETIDIDCLSRYVVGDRGEVYAPCSNKAEMVILDGSSGDVQKRLALPDTAETVFNVGQPAHLASQERELYVATDTGVLRIDAASNELNATIEVDDAASIGAVAYDGVREELYVTTVKGFDNRGGVTVYDRPGDRVASFQASIAPTYIDFRRISE